MLAEPFAFTVHDGRPARRMVALPLALMVAELVTLASIVAVPSAPIVASAAVSWAASMVEMPRTIAVSFFVDPSSAALALPIAVMNSNALHHNYYWQIMLPGSVVGLIVGYATQRYVPSRGSAVRA